MRFPASAPLGSASIPIRSRTWLRRSVLPMLLVIWWLTTPASASFSYCNQTCDYDSLCAKPCIENYDDPSTCGQFGVCYEPGYCGDGFCGELDGETVSNCSSDCFIGPGSTPPPDEPTCGNSVCETGESDKSCPGDCPTGSVACGDGICETGETFNNCTADCVYTDYCNSISDCPTYYSCRAKRCVYDSLGTVCYASSSGSECGSNEVCAQKDDGTGIGICMPFF